MFPDFDRLCLNCMNASMVRGVCSSCKKPAGFAQKPAFALPPGTILDGSYLIGAVLGCGGFGITYIGLDLKSGSKVAVKEFMPHGLAGRNPGSLKICAKGQRETFQYGLKQFVNEARTIYRYREHPHIVHVMKMFQENQTAYYVMEYLQGDDFKHFLRRSGGQTNFETVMEVTLPVMDALECIHRDHVIHRDVSPDNIYIGNGEQGVKLIDFGAARVAVAGQSKSLSVILKRGFAPEEQYRSKGKQGPWTDIYALAGTMYLSLTGIMVPEAPERLADDKLKDLRLLEKDIPEFSASAIMKALAVKAKDRYSSVAAFRRALLGYRERQEDRRNSVCTPTVRIIGRDGYFSDGVICPEGEITLGRNPYECQLVFPTYARGVSSVHCRIVTVGDETGYGVFLEDLGSTYGTWLNGRRLLRGELVPLKGGDQFIIGENQLFEVQEYVS